MCEAEPVDHEPWPLRALLLLALGAALALAVHLLTSGPAAWQWTENPLRLGAAAALAAGGIVFAFSLERPRWLWSLLFAAGAGLVVGFVTYWNGRPDSWGAGEGWQLASALLALVIAVPLFQASRDSGRWNLDYRAVHAHILTNIALWVVAWGFVLITFLLILLLSELFQLIGIDLLKDLLDEEWFPWILIGGALGAAVGLLRDRDKIVDTLQRVATAILSFLAPILAVGLVLFVLALPFTGLEPLWRQTRDTTPILLVCILGAVVLINAVVGSGAKDDEARPRIVRWAAAALAAVVLPLAIVAAVSTGKRIAQHGFTPDRLWAAVFVAITVAGAAAYLFAVVRGRSGWPALLRTLNLRIAVGICLVALFLALPIVSFGAISTRDQVARLQSGRIAPDRFDWAALRFDFGPSGRRALERLAASPDLVLRQRAREALKATTRWYAGPADRELPERPAGFEVDGGAPVPATLADMIGRTGTCREEKCRLVFVEPKRAVVLRPGCPNCVYVFDSQPDGTWAQHVPASGAAAPAPPPDLARGRVEIRPIERKQLFVDGRPVGDPFE
ncbi:MAG TPA: DUF4153 domain-containing protein [Allosphingosinicella sp.]|jgi:hypothetical protein|nr:DUF4153 domain-containing protein [Allosphingosinicella sp.]